VPSKAKSFIREHFCHTFFIVTTLSITPTVCLSTPIIGSPTGLAGPKSTISFSEATTADNQVITNEFAAFGASFSNFGIDKNNQFGIADSVTPGFSGDYLAAGGFGFPDTTPHSIKFTTDVTEAAFAVVDGGNTYSFSAYLDDTLIESFSALVNFVPGSGYMGFSESLFNRIEVTPLFAGLKNIAIDDLQFKPAASVPTPATIGLFSLALAGMGWSRRRT
jgi:hypothetical protein